MGTGDVPDIRVQIIAIDYDGTYSSDPKTWHAVIDTLKAAGNVVFMVTYRFPDRPIEGLQKSLEIFYTSGNQKHVYMQNAGIEVDVWIDDEPHLIGTVSR
jgi:hypothetical protein